MGIGEGWEGCHSAVGSSKIAQLLWLVKLGFVIPDN